MRPHNRSFNTTVIASHLNQKYALEDKILKEYPQEMKRLSELIAGYITDIRSVEQNTPADKKSFPPMKIGGILFTEKAEAGKAIIEACRAMLSPDPVPLGEYRGFFMELSFDTFRKEYRVAIHGALTHEVYLGNDIHGNITRLNNKLEGFTESLRNCKNKLANTQMQLEAAKVEVGQPFSQEQEYAEKSTRLKELNIPLNMDQKGHEILDVEPDESDMAPQRRALEYER